MLVIKRMVVCAFLECVPARVTRRAEREAGDERRRTRVRDARTGTARTTGIRPSTEPLRHRAPGAPPAHRAHQGAVEQRTSGAASEPATGTARTTARRSAAPGSPTGSALLGSPAHGAAAGPAPGPAADGAAHLRRRLLLGGLPQRPTAPGGRRSGAGPPHPAAAGRFPVVPTRAAGAASAAGSPRGPGTAPATGCPGPPGPAPLRVALVEPPRHACPPAGQGPSPRDGAREAFPPTVRVSPGRLKVG